MKVRFVGFTVSAIVGAAATVKVTGIDWGVFVAPDPVTVTVDV